jgi:YVTN family beta-propeller protein
LKEAAVAESQSGTVLAGYRLGRLLGRGGMGAVYLAVDEGLGRRVALKLLAPELAEDERFRERFLRESKLAASLDHPAIVPIFQAGEADGTLFIAMRYVEGSDLRRLLEQGPLEPLRTLAIASQVASALDVAHRRGLVHRDVKPGNVLLDEEHNAYLSDFGLTKQASSQSGLTQTGQLVGTLDYIAPEQIEGRKVDGRADVYSLGCLLYECLTGRKPFARESEAATLWAHVHDPAPETGDAAVDAVLARALAKRPDERYATAGDLVAELRRALGISTGELVRPPRARRRRRLLASLLAAGAVLAAVLVAVLSFAGGGGGALEVAPNSVAIIDPETGEVEGDVPVGSIPTAIAAGEGGVWVANFDDSTVSRIDPATRKVIRVIPLKGTPTGVAASGGRVWVATGNPRTGKVYRIDPQYNRITGTADVAVDSRFFDRRAIAAQDDIVWVANLDGTAVKIDPDDAKATTEIAANVGSFPSIALGFGSVWVGNGYNNEVARIDLATGAVIKLIQVGDGPSNIAVGAGAVWVTNRYDDTVMRIDPTSNVVAETIRVGEHPIGIAVGGGAVWVANSRDGTISKIDPRTNRVVRVVPIGNEPMGITVADGRLWVTVAPDPFGTSRKTRANGAILRVASPGLAFDSTDPAIAYSGGPGGAWQLEQATCAKLLNYPDRPTPEGSTLVPEVARELPVVSDGGKTYTFRIRPGFRFSPPSNAPVTAQTFKSTIERTLNKVMRSPAVSNGYLDDIVGARAYEAGKAPHIAGIAARGDTLTIRLLKPDGALPSKLAMPFFCAVPVGTPVDPDGLPTIPSAGPYYLASYTYGSSAILRRNPNYHGSRPRRPVEIHYTLDVGAKPGLAAVEVNEADYYGTGGYIPEELDRLRARYGSGSPAAQRRFYANPKVSVLYLPLNTSRPLFANVRLRRAVNFAIDRGALLKLFPGFRPTDQYLPPGMPGFTDVDVYPFEPDLAEARRLAGPGKHGTAVLYMGNAERSPQIVAIITKGLEAIGIDVEVRQFPHPVHYTKHAVRGEPFDISFYGWATDYLDPSGFLNYQFSGRSLRAEGNTNLSYFDDPEYNRRLAAAERLTGPARSRAYGELDVDLARNAAPVVAWGTQTDHELFSARIGCQVYQPSAGAVDLAALCIRDAKD